MGFVQSCNKNRDVICIALLCCSVMSLEAVQAQLILAMQWPVTYCKMNDYKCCCPPEKRQEFLIHGLWYGNTNCNLAKSFNPSEIRELVRRRLNREWPSLQYSRSEFFWQCEWMKHASCLGINPPEYFNITLRLKEIVEPALANVLAYRGKPLVDSVRNALHANTGVYPMIGCSENDLLTHIYFCFRATTNATTYILTSCAESYRNCGRQVIFPRAEGHNWCRDRTHCPVARNMSTPESLEFPVDDNCES